jgi:hypothetical protein
MKRPALPTLLAIAIAACAASSAEAQRTKTAAPPAPATEDYYFTCVSALRPGDLESLQAIDFGKLRRSYLEATRGTRLPPKDTTLEDKLGAAFDSGQWAEVVKLADAILASNFTRIRAHVLKAGAQNELGQDPRFHATIAHNLLESILVTGDGSEGRPYHVLSVEEEYDVLKRLQLQKVRQALLTDPKHKDRHLDELECQDRRDGRTVFVYFDINEFYGRWRGWRK